MIIIESHGPRKIGELFTLPQFQDGPTGNTRAVIIREATEQEYIDDCLADPTCPPESRRLMILTGRTDIYWYAVETD